MESWKTHRLRPQKISIIPGATEADASKVRIENHRSAVLSCEFHKSGRFIVSSNRRGQIHICPTDGATEKFAYLKGHFDQVNEVHYSTDGLSVYSGSKDRTVCVWDAFKGVRTSAIVGHSDSVNTVQCVPSANPILCSGSADKTIRTWDIRQRDCGTLLKSRHEVTATTFSGCGQYIFSGGLTSGDITVWDLRQNAVFQTLLGHSDSVTGLALSPCRKYLASCSKDNTLRKWDVTSPTETENDVWSSPLEQGELCELSRCDWSADGSLLSAGSAGNKAVIFSAKCGEQYFELDGHTGAVIDVAFHPRKFILVSAGVDKSLILHEV